MPTYRYKAKQGPEQLHAGELIASSREDAVEKISQRGFLPVSVEECGTLRSSAVRLSPRNVTWLCRQLAILLRSGVPIFNALTVLSEQTAHPSVRRVVSELRNDVKDGAELSVAMERFPRVFSPVVRALIQAGEAGGVLQETLMTLAGYRQEQERIAARVKAALIYPVLLAGVGGATILFMLLFVLPQMTGLFARLGQQLPLATRVVIYAGQVAAHPLFWLLLVISTLGVLLLWQIAQRFTACRVLAAKARLQIPLFGPLLFKDNLGRFCRTLSLLLKSGVPFVRALRLSAPSVNSIVLRQVFEQGVAHLEQGGTFTEILRRYSLFPALLINMLRVGEETGRLDEALTDAALVYEEETADIVATITNALEPVMVLIMGVIVGFIVMAMLWPVFELNLTIALTPLRFRGCA